MTIISTICAEKMAARQPSASVMNIIVALMVVTQVGAAYDPEASITGLYTGPYFDPLAPRNLTAHLGDRAELPCTVRQLGDKSVSWVRMRDADILTVDRYTFVGDERFEAQYSIPAETWNLIINYVQERDAGDYECQVSTEPKMSQFFNLRVVVPQVNIEPPGDRHVKSGSKVRIDCHITDVVQIPDYIFWYHDNVRVLDRTDENLDVTVTRTSEESIMSSLHIERVRKDQSGNYTCMPSNLHAAFTLLHVLNEEHPAAMQDGRNEAPFTRLSPALVAVVVFLLVLAHLESSSACSQQNIHDHNSNVEDWFGGKNTDCRLHDAVENDAIISVEGQVGVTGSMNGVAGPSGRVGALVKKLLETAQEHQERNVFLMIDEVLTKHQKLGSVSCGLLNKTITEQELLADFNILASQKEGSTLKISSCPTVLDEQFFFHPNGAIIKRSSSQIILNNDNSEMSQDQNSPEDFVEGSSATLTVTNPDHLSSAALNLNSPMVLAVQLMSR